MKYISLVAVLRSCTATERPSATISSVAGGAYSNRNFPGRWTKILPSERLPSGPIWTKSPVMLVAALKYALAFWMAARGSIGTKGLPGAGFAGAAAGLAGLGLAGDGSARRGGAPAGARDN